MWREERSRGNEVKNGEPTAHINTFGRYDLFTDETNTMGDKLSLATRESLDGRIKNAEWGQKWRLSGRVPSGSRT